MEAGPDVCGEIVRILIEEGVTTRGRLEDVKRRACAGAGCARVPTDAELLARLPPGVSHGLVGLLRTKPSRTLSGVAVVAVMSPPAACPHGRCAYCPGGVEEGTPQSYTGEEPAARRARRAGYDPAAQVRDRLAQLGGIGHPTDKVELVVMGGTFPATERSSRDAFVRACLEALGGAPAADLTAAIAANEGAPHRCVALTLETRPDLCTPAGVDDLLGLGATRVEVGVQTTDDRALARVGRGHGSRESVEATRALKDAGLKVGHHLMPGLPGLTREEDLRAMLRVVEDPDFRPDLLKLYPTLVMPGTALHKSWLRGEYVPLDDAAAVALLADFKSRLPRWVRVSRVERDIPAGLIAAGVRASNIRQLVQGRLRERGLRCACIRCREVGRLGTERPGRGTASPDPRGLVVREERYGASGGEELFLSLELPEGDALVAYARVRRPSPRAWRPELAGAAVLREVRVLGEVLPLHARPRDDAGSLEWQHRGLGARLVGLSEEAARAWGMDRLAVMAGMGTRGYFRRLGYSLDGPYMVSPRL
jgi:elongator complex protein 3